MRDHAGARYSDRMRRVCLTLVPLLLLVLAACAPTGSDERVGVQQLTEPITYYPSQTGARWEYLPNGVRLDEPRIVETIEGPSVLEGDVWIAWHLVGRGLDITRYRQYRPDGVFLKREDKIGTQITFDPPMKAGPAEGELRVGSTWSGHTTVTVDAPESNSPEARRSLDVDYVYTVVDKRNVTLAAGTFEVFVVSFTSRTVDENENITNELTQQHWFAPFVGDVRDEANNFLVASNVLAPPPEGAEE